MKSSGQLDWLAATFPASVIPNGTLPREACQSPFRLVGRGSQGYRDRLTNDDGASILLNGQERQGVHLILPGSALEHIRMMGLSERDLCQHVMDAGGKVARLDLALNLYDGQLTVRDFVTAYTVGRLKTPARASLELRQPNRPDHTLYLGSPTSNKRLRIYNKAAEEGIDDMSWVRLELQCRRQVANKLARIVAREDNTRSIVNTVIGGFCHMPGSEEYDDALKDQRGAIPEEGRKVTDRYKWLMEQVAPALAREEAEHPDRDVLGAFLTVVGEYRKRYQKDGQGEDGQGVAG